VRSPDQRELIRATCHNAPRGIVRIMTEYDLDGIVSKVREGDAG
jgi:hypothetical protein